MDKNHKTLLKYANDPWVVNLPVQWLHPGTWALRDPVPTCNIINNNNIIPLNFHCNQTKIGEDFMVKKKARALGSLDKS